MKRLAFCLALCACKDPSPPPAAQKPAETAQKPPEAPPTQEQLVKQLEGKNPHDFDLGGEPPKPPPTPVQPPLTPTKTAERLKSGIATEVIAPGKGKRHPQDKDKVSMLFALWSKDGKLIEGPGNQPEYMEVAGMPGWVEGMKLMVEGEKRRVWIPAKLATIPGKKDSMGDVIVDLELVEILTQAPK